MTHSYLHGTRVGEASNPGPKKKSAAVRIAVCNPHAILSHKKDILNFKSDIVFVAETSATKSTQSEFQFNIAKHGFKCYWSPPVEAKYQSILHEYSLRGEPLGAAVLTSLPSRDLRAHIPSHLWATNRIAVSVVNIGSCDTLCVTVYGFAKKCFDGKRLNDLLLARVFNVVSESHMPFIIGGDFNECPRNLSSFSAFQEIGAFEAHSYCEHSLGYKLPPTCRGATFNDSFIFHPWFRERISDTQVHDELQMDSHSTLIVTLDLNKVIPPQLKWDIPITWADLDIDTEILATCYHKKFELSQLKSLLKESHPDPEQLLQSWSSLIERSVDATVQIQHKLDQVRYPTPGLSKAHFGRCQSRELINHDVRNPPKGDALKGYDPPEEIFREKSKKKVKQCRRIRSLMKAVKNIDLKKESSQEITPSMMKQLQQEWGVILQAQGYGKSWQHWILQFECVPVLSTDIPVYDELHILAQLTEHDCNHACAIECANRKKNNKRLFQVDMKDGSGKMVYRRVKNKPIQTLTTVPFFKKSWAVLCRSTKGQTILSIRNDEIFHSGELCTFGNAKVKILTKVQNRVHITAIDGTLPSHGELVCTKFAYHPSQVCQEFENFWKPIWMREDDISQVDVDQWESFLDEIHDIEFPNISMQIDLHSPEVWEKTIRKLKKGTAHGVCGWRAEELQLIPREAIAHLSNIFLHIWPVGMPPQMMKARTILLAKKAQPQNMNDSRPITILSLICRLASKLVSDQILSQLAKQLPEGISGGLPQRGVKDISLLQHSRIEHAIFSQEDMGGFTLDLSKAFNKIPRAPLRRLFDKCSIPKLVADFWFESLKHLKRYPQVLGSLGPAISSTCGIPEGDSLSVVGMVVLSCAYFHKMAHPKLDPYAYADNWTWLTNDFKEQFRALCKVLNFVRSLRMGIDLSKSWAWGATASFRKQCQLLNLIFPDQSVSIDIKESAKDLGIELHYNKKPLLGSIAGRIKDGIRRCDRLRWIPIETSQTARIIQTGIWPAALHSADAQFVGEKHWNNLRRAATRALVGDHKYACSYLGCSVLSTSLQDPLLYTICQLLRAIRRCAHFHPECAKAICDLAETYNGKTVYGPSGALSRYLAKIGWKFKTSSIIIGPGGNEIHLFVHSPKEIQAILNDSWNTFVHNQIQHRKGILESGIDLKTTARVLKSFSPVEQKILALNMVGGYQTGAVKTLWANDCDGTCPFCGQKDGRLHRILECQQFQEIRNKHPAAIHILQSSRKEWVYLPIARPQCDKTFIKMLNNGRKIIKPEGYELHDPSSSGHTTLRFYTDGSCINPMQEDAKLAAWAVIQDSSVDADDREEIMIAMKDLKGSVPKMNCVATGVVTGRQTAARAELSSVLFATELSCLKHPQHKVEIFTDAKYVCNVVDAIKCSDTHTLHYKMANQDLVSRLADIWNPNLHQVIKVKAHRSFDDAVDEEDLWHVLGNNCADMAANAANQLIPSAFAQALSDSATFARKEFSNLRCVLIFILELNLHQMYILAEGHKTTIQQSQSHNGKNGDYHDLLAGNDHREQTEMTSYEQALEHLITWTPPAFTNFSCTST